MASSLLTPALSSGAEVYRGAFARGWVPDPELTVSEWAEKHRWLSDVGAAEPGFWRNNRTPYLVEIMDLLSVNDPTTELCFMKAAQIGATEALVNAIGYVIHHAPGPALLVEPTLELLKKVSKQRLAPAILETPELLERVGEARERDSGNTLFSKSFPGGILNMTTANSAAGLRSMPIRFLFADEVDAYPGDVDGEGDPIELARKRTVTFRGRRKCAYISTPKDRGPSRIEKLYKASDQRRFFIPCPECGHMDFLTWSGFADFLAGKDGGHHYIAWDPGQPETAHMVCGRNGCRIPETKKPWMMERGRWIATSPGPGKMPGFHLSALYTMIGQRWADCATEFLAVKDDPPLFRVWVNTVLGESWEERGSITIDVESLLARRCGMERAPCPAYPSSEGPEPEQLVPTGVGLTIGAIDVQKDRLEWEVIGYGAGEESWVLSSGAQFGDPNQEKVWLDLERDLLEPLKHEGGRAVQVAAIAVDTRYASEQAYRFCHAGFWRTTGRTLGVRGGQLVGAPIAGTATRSNAYRVPVWTICTDTAKERIYARLQIPQPGPGYIHLPAWVDEEYVEQLTAEKPQQKWVNGRRERVWKKRNNRERNERLDLHVYALAALYILGPKVIRSLGDLARDLAKPPEGPAPAPVPVGVQAPAAILRRQRGNWVNRWKR